MKGTLNYKEYTCTCGGRTERRSIDVTAKGFFKVKYTVLYYYECMNCDITSTTFEADITHKFR